MNKHILMAMDSLANPEKYTFEQLRENRDDAYADNADNAAYAALAATDAIAANYADAAANAAYAALAATDAIAANYADAAAYAAVDAAYTVAVYANAADNADYWLNRYFKYSGENKQDYIDEINKGYKHEQTNIND